MQSDITFCRNSGTQKRFCKKSLAQGLTTGQRFADMVRTSAPYPIPRRFCFNSVGRAGDEDVRISGHEQELQCQDSSLLLHRSHMPLRFGEQFERPLSCGLYGPCGRREWQGSSLPDSRSLPSAQRRGFRLVWKTASGKLFSRP